jgi:hypothetical protein
MKEKPNIDAFEVVNPKYTEISPDTVAWESNNAIPKANMNDRIQRFLFLIILEMFFLKLWDFTSAEERLGGRGGFSRKNITNKMNIIVHSMAWVRRLSNICYLADS